MMEQCRNTWQTSKAYRFLLVAAAIYFVLRLGVQFAFLVLLPQYGDAAYEVPVDLQIYLDAARRLQERTNLYPQGPDQIEVYQYAPSYALLFTSALWLSPIVVAILHTVLHVVSYVLLYLSWDRIAARAQLEALRSRLAWSLPIWLLFSSFWTDLGYLNIYIVVALLATWLIENILEKNLGRSILWLSIILQIKPHWAFAAVVPLLMGHYRFFLKLVGSAAAIYGLVTAVTIGIVGPAYGIKQYQDYVGLLSNMRAYFPWRGPDARYLGYNHSIAQIVTFFLGVTPVALRLATAIKVILLIPLGWVSIKHWLRSTPTNGTGLPGTALQAERRIARTTRSPGLLQSSLTAGAPSRGGLSTRAPRCGCSAGGDLSLRPGNSSTPGQPAAPPLGMTGSTDHTTPMTGSLVFLDLVFAFYLGAFIWLDMVWELSLGVVVYAYLMATIERRWVHIVASGTFLTYALLDPLRLVSYGLSMTGLEIVDPGPYILTDPNIYVPTIMLSILVFYATLVLRLGSGQLQEQI